MKFSSEPTVDQLLDLSQGAKLAALVQPLTEDLNKLAEQTQARIFTAISKGEMTPEMAVQGWHELHSYHRLLQRYNQRIKIGQSVGEALHKGD